MDIGVFKSRPELLVDLSTTERFSFDPDTLRETQLAGLRKRFAELTELVPVLKKFKQEQNVHEIRSIEDGALLLFPHTVYKSYPQSIIEKGRYDQLTRWLSMLTALDLSKVDASGCQAIDDWIDALDLQSDVCVKHSSGTGGKLSFIPASTEENRLETLHFNRHWEGFGDEPDRVVKGVGEAPLIGYSYRYGAIAPARNLQAQIKFTYHGDESKVIALYPGRISADVLSLGGRLQGARAKGELGQAALPAALLARRNAFITEQAGQPLRIRAFLEQLAGQLRGQRVIMKGIVPLVLDIAVQGLDMGIENLFAPDSLASFFGGTKGRNLPDNYKEIITRFTGVPFPRLGYGMSESPSSFTRMCPAGHYHINPSTIPYLLDPKTGAPYPRTGRHVGRFGIIDLATTTRWGGFLTGDEVTLDWGDKNPCPCARKGAYMNSDLRRYSEQEGGDDKITCAGTPEVHDKALEFIAQGIEQ